MTPDRLVRIEVRNPGAADLPQINLDVSVTHFHAPASGRPDCRPALG
jgi:hypothetical protein